MAIRAWGADSSGSSNRTAIVSSLGPWCGFDTTKTACHTESGRVQPAARSDNHGTFLGASCHPQQQGSGLGLLICTQLGPAASPLQSSNKTIPKSLRQE